MRRTVYFVIALLCLIGHSTSNLWAPAHDNGLIIIGFAFFYMGCMKNPIAIEQYLKNGKNKLDTVTSWTVLGVIVLNSICPYFIPMDSTLNTYFMLGDVVLTVVLFVLIYLNHKQTEKKGK